MKSVDLFQAFSEIEPKYMDQTDIFHRKAPTWRVIMKKTTKLALSAAAVVLVLGFILTAWWLQSRYGVAPAQEGEEEPLRICADIGLGGFTQSPEEIEEALNRFLHTVSEKGGPNDVELQVIPTDLSKRETVLTQIRMEIMAGGGPDIFICNCLSPASSTGEEALFPFPNKAMENGYFLNLNDFITNTQFVKWDDLIPKVMEAGKNDDGQVLIPLTYSFPVTIFRSSDVDLFPATTTWDDIVDGKDQALKCSMEPLLSSLFPVYEPGFHYFSCIWEEIADYRNDVLTLSENDLLQRVKESRLLQSMAVENVPPHFRGVLDRHMFLEGKIDPNMIGQRGGLSPSEEMTMVPLYGSQGGVNVFVKTYAGINAKTERPEDAFFILDLLMSEEIQENSFLFKDILGVGCLPTNMNVKMRMTGEAFSAYQEVRDQIMKARFFTPLDGTIVSVLSQCEMMGEDVDEVSLSDMVKKAYLEMEKMLDES